jgi:hypothetical protein
MRTTIMIAWAMGVLVACLGGCPAATNPSDGALLPTDPNSSADSTTVQGGSATADDTSAADANDPATSASQPGPSEPFPLLYRPPHTFDSAGQGDAADTGTSGAAPAGGTSQATILDAVDFVATQFVTAAEVFGTLGELGSPNLNFAPYQEYEWGTCPVVRVAVGEDAIGILLSLDFGDGCSAPSTAGEVVVGTGGGMDYTEGDPPAVIFAYLTIDGHEVQNLLPYPEDTTSGNAIMTGTFTLHDQGLQLAGTCDFAVKEIGGTAGDLVLDFGRNYTQTYTQADLTFSADGRQQAATLTAVSVAPALYGNFLPYVGSATFTVSAADGPHTVEVQFTTATPVQRVVEVRVDGGEPFAYRLPPS